MNCESFQLVLADLVGGELGPDGEAEARAHLRDCARCREREIPGG